MAEDQENYRLAIEILDEISEEMRDKRAGAWQFARISATRSLILQLIENENVSEMYAVFGRSPRFIRPFIRISVVDRLDRKKHKLIGYELLVAAREEFNKSEYKSTENGFVLAANPSLFKYAANLFE